MEWLISHWEYVLLGILVADKIVTVTPTKRDDLILSIIKDVLRRLFPGKALEEKKSGKEV